jgi:hypothetical protein
MRASLRVLRAFYAALDDEQKARLRLLRDLTLSGSGRPNFRTSFSGIGVVRSDGINREVSNPRVSGIRPIFVAALAAAMLPACTQSCDTLSSGQQFSIATDLFAHPMSIYWRDWLFSKTHDVSPWAHR